MSIAAFVWIPRGITATEFFAAIGIVVCFCAVVAVIRSFSTDCRTGVRDAMRKHYSDEMLKYSADVIKGSKNK